MSQRQVTPGLLQSEDDPLGYAFLHWPGWHEEPQLPASALSHVSSVNKYSKVGASSGAQRQENSGDKVVSGSPRG